MMYLTVEEPYYSVSCIKIMHLLSPRLPHLKQDQIFFCYHAKKKFLYEIQINYLQRIQNNA